MADMGAVHDAYTLAVLECLFGDLISYQNDGKYSTAIVGKVEIA